MSDRKVLRDIKKILVLAKSAHDHLEENKIKKATRELKRILSYDADEITRLQGLGKNDKVKNLLLECGVIFRDAKNALNDLRSGERPPEVVKLVQSIEAVIGHQLVEIKELTFSEPVENHLSFEEGLTAVFSHVLRLLKAKNTKKICTKLNSIYKKQIDEWTEEEKKFEKNMPYWPVLLVIYGGYDAGKTHFSSMLKERLRTAGYIANSSTMTPGEGSFIMGKDKWRRVYWHVQIWQVPWLRTKKNYRSESDPNVQLRKKFGKGIDVNIAIYNPEYKMPSGRIGDGTYDFIIRNPASISKRYKK